MTTTGDQRKGRTGGGPWGKTALVLAGGGVTGIAYELGVLHALDCSLRDLSVNNFDIYVGTSAGATVAAMLANGFSPGEMWGSVEGDYEKVRPFLRENLWRFNSVRFLQAGMRVPERVRRVGERYLQDFRGSNLFGSLWVMLDLLPPSLYDSTALEAYLRGLIADLGGTNEFDELEKELDIVATRLDSGERMVFNQDSGGDVRISEAVSASAAVPALYKPVRLNGVDYVDGGVRGNASIDLAVERGASVVICINPIVPYDGQALTKQAESGNNRFRKNKLSMQAVVSQALRTRMHAGFHYHIKHLRHVYPHVDFYLIEPEQDGGEMSVPNFMRYDSHTKIARQAFASTAKQLAQDEKAWQMMWERYEVAVRPLLPSDGGGELADVVEANWPPPIKNQPQSDLPQRLESALTTLTETLEKWDADV
jgi:predicted acylesterase/phospholipase RssA